MVMAQMRTVAYLHALAHNGQMVVAPVIDTYGIRVSITTQF